MSDTKTYVALEEIVVFKKPKPGVGAHKLVLAGEELEGADEGRPHTSLTPWGEFIYTAVKVDKTVGYVLSQYIEEKK